jgi:predicted nucleic acid-binding protein
MIILDTNVISELMRPQPERAVVRWLDARPSSSLFTTAITQAEILRGIASLPRGRRREAIASAAIRMFEDELAGRVLPFASEAANAYAEIATTRRRRGRPISPFDAQIAAIARSTRAELATRNLDDFDGCGIDVVDPWTA